jgi:hypothetical protein
MQRMAPRRNQLRLAGWLAGFSLRLVEPSVRLARQPINKSPALVQSVERLHSPNHEDEGPRRSLLVPRAPEHDRSEMALAQTPD